MTLATRTIRPQPLHAETFAAWRVTDLNEWAHENCRAITLDATTLDEARNMAIDSACLNHKEKLAILHQRRDGRAVLHIYAVKQRSAAAYERDPATGLTRSFRPLYVDRDPVVSMRVAAFEPVEARS